MVKECCAHGRVDLAADVYLPLYRQFNMQPDAYTYMHIIGAYGANGEWSPKRECGGAVSLTFFKNPDDFERAVAFVYELRASGVQMNEGFYRSIMSTAARRGDVASIVKFFNDLKADELAIGERTAKVLVSALSRALMINELRDVVAYLMSGGAQLTEDMIFPLLRAEYEAGNTAEARALLSALTRDLLSPKVLSLLIDLEAKHGAEGLLSLLDTALSVGVIDTRFVTLVVSRLRLLGDHDALISAARRAARGGVVLEAHLTKHLAWALTKDAVPSLTVREPRNVQRDRSLIESLLALPDEELFNVELRVKEARRELDVSLPLVVRAYHALCCIRSEAPERESLTRDTVPQLDSFTEHNILPLQRLVQAIASDHGFAAAWHFVWFFHPAFAKKNNRGEDVLAFYLLIERLPLRNHRDTLRDKLRSRYALNKVIALPMCARCGRKGHVVTHCNTWDKCRLCGGAHKIFECSMFRCRLCGGTHDGLLCPTKKGT